MSGAPTIAAPDGAYPASAASAASATSATSATSAASAASSKGPIFSLEAEQSVLGALLLDNGAYDKIADILCAADFYVGDHAVLYRAIEAILNRGRQADVITVYDHLQNTAAAIDAPLVYLNELVQNTPGALNVRRYAEIVRDRAALRSLVSAARKIIDSAYATRSREVAQIIDAAQAEVMAVGDTQRRAQDGFVPLDGFVGEALGHVAGMAERARSGEPLDVIGLPTGFAALDHLTAGLMPGDLIVLAARPSMGKTALALNIAEHAALAAGRSAAFVSLEMRGAQLAMRMLSSQASLNQQRLRVGRVYDAEWPRINHAAERLRAAPLYLMQASLLTPAGLRARVRRLYRELRGQLGLLVVDYLQLMFGERDAQNRAVEVSEISRSLKLLALELDIPVLALAQVNRNVEQRPNRRPIMSDLRDSGGIEQDADVILFIYRDEVYHPDSPEHGSAEIIVAKQRNGALGTVKLGFRADTMRFSDMSATAADAII